MKQPHELDALLARRTVPEPASNLAERIIAAAHPHPVRTPVWRIAGGGFMEWLMPRSAYALAAALVLGVFAGWQGGSMESLPTDAQTSAELFGEEPIL